MRLHHLSCVLLVATVPLAAQNQVWLVAPAQPFDPPTDTQAIVNSAKDGDVLLFSSGSYPGCVIDGKALTLAEDTGATAVLEWLVVRDLQAGKAVLVSGLEVRGAPGFTDPLVELLLNEGGITLRDVVVSDGHGTMLGGEPDVALLIEDCGSVVLLDCLVEGRRNDEPFGVAKGSSAPALEVDGGFLALLGGQVLGAEGLNAFDTFTTLQLATPGERAARLRAGTIFISGTEVRGGQGGNGNSTFTGSCLDPADGGDAIDASAGSPTLLLHDALLAGGEGGDGTLACPATGSPGLPIFPASEPVLELPGAHLPLLVPPLAREGDPLPLVITGPPGSLAVLLAGSRPLALPLPAKQGALLLDPLLVLLADVVPPSGALGVDATAPPLPAGIEGLPVLLQSAFLAPAGVALGDGSLVLLLDAGF